MVTRSKLCLKLQGVVAFAHREQRVSLIEQTSVWTVLSETVGCREDGPDSPNPEYSCLGLSEGSQELW